MTAALLPNSVVFDMGGVLIDWSPDYLYKKLIPDVAKRQDFYTNVCTREWHENHDAGVTFADNGKPLLAKYDGNPEMQVLIAAWNERFFEMFNGPIQGTVDILDELLDRKTPIYGLTNWSHESFERTKRDFPFLNRFQDVIVSGHEKVKKPDRKIYEILVQRAKRQPQEMVFIDDRDENLQPAKDMGFEVIEFKSPDELRSSLKKLNLL